MEKFFKSGGAFLVLALAFMVIGATSEKPAVYIALGAVWLILGLGMAAKNKKQLESDRNQDTH